MSKTTDVNGLAQRDMHRNIKEYCLENRLSTVVRRPIASIEEGQISKIWIKIQRRNIRWVNKALSAALTGRARFSWFPSPSAVPQLLLPLFGACRALYLYFSTEALSSPFE